MTGVVLNINKHYWVYELYGFGQIMQSFSFVKSDNNSIYLIYLYGLKEMIF